MKTVMENGRGPSKPIMGRGGQAPRTNAKYVSPSEQRSVGDNIRMLLQKASYKILSWIGI
jgi:hypothetical protein